MRKRSEKQMKNMTLDELISSVLLTPGELKCDKAKKRAAKRTLKYMKDNPPAIPKETLRQIYEEAKEGKCGEPMLVVKFPKSRILGESPPSTKKGFSFEIYEEHLPKE